MVSLGKSGALIFSFYHSSTRALLAASSSSSRGSNLSQQRRAFLAATTGLVTAASFSFPYIVYAQAGRCENSPPGSSTSTCRSMSSTQASSPSPSSSSSFTGYLNAADAAALDAELMSTPGFSLEQLMELAGLSVAEAVYQVLPPPQPSPSAAESGNGVQPKILLVCGPGNNGGDGLVAARHLKFFGYDCVVVYPKQSSKQHFVNLVQQCKDVDVSVLEEMPADLNEYDGIVDAIFGFSFKGAPREPFATALQQMIEAQQKGKVAVISVDVPSGWNVDEGDVANTGFVPDVLVSLTTPKESARRFQGRHFVGGRFLPPKLAEKYQVQMPPYPGVSQVMEVSKANDTGESSSSSAEPGRREVQPAGGPSEAMGWEAEYAAYLQNKDRQQLENDTDTDHAVSSLSAVPQHENIEENETWERQYAEYCAEKQIRLAREDEKQIEEMKKNYHS